MTEQGAKPRKRLSLNPIPEEAREHARAARAEMRLMVETIVPKPILERERAARRKTLIMLRDMLDRAIERLGE